jgi:hypothetical protein
MITALDDTKGIQSEPCKLGKDLFIFPVNGTWPRGMIPGTLVRLFSRLSWTRLLSKTGAKQESLWYQLNSDFRQSLENHGNSLGRRIHFQDFEWPGHNTIESRAKAAHDLRERLAKSLKDQPEKQHVIVAHSHGGNVAVHALHLLGPEGRSVALVAMATPFLHIHHAPLNGVLRKVLQVGQTAPWLLLMGILLAMLNGDLSPLWNRVVQLIFAALFGCLILLIIHWQSKTTKNLDKGNLEGYKILSVRSPGDEASLVLAAAGFFSWINRSLLTIVARWYPPLTASVFPDSQAASKRFKKSKSRTSYVLLTTILVGVLCFCFMRGPSWFVSSEPNAAEWAGFAVLLICCFFALVLVRAWLWMFYTILLVIISAPVVFATSLFIAPFGIELVLFGLNLVTYAECLPEGEGTVVMVPWKPGLGFLKYHSIHSSPAAREVIAKWLSRL